MAEVKFRTDKSVLNELQKWLLQLHGEEVCPNLQPNVHDVKSLLTLKKLNEESEKNVTEEIKLKKTRIHSLNSKTDEMRTLLKSEDVCLSDETWKQVESIAGLAAKMNLEELNLTNFLLAICNLKNGNIRNEEKRMNNCALMSSYSQQNLKIKQSNDTLKSQLDALKEVVEIQESNKVKIAENINFFNAKSAEYERNVNLYKDRLKDVNFERALQHCNLVEWSKAIEVLEKKLKVSMEKLRNYKKLPPNEKLTELKIQEKKEELKQLEDEFTALIEMWEKRNIKE